MPPIKKIPHEAPPESPIAYADRQYNTPIVDLLDKLIRKSGMGEHPVKDYLDQHAVAKSSDVSPVDKKAVDFYKNWKILPKGETPESLAQKDADLRTKTPAQLRGFSTGALESLNPAHVAQSAFLGTGVPAMLASAAIAGHGLHQATAPNSSIPDRILGGIDAVSGAAGFIPGAAKVIGDFNTKRAINALSSTEAKKALDKALQVYKDIRGNQVLSGHEELALVKAAAESDPEIKPLLDHISRYPADHISKSLQSQGFPTEKLSLNEQAALDQKMAARDLGASVELQKGKADVKAAKIKDLDAQAQVAQQPSILAAEAEETLAKEAAKKLAAEKKAAETQFNLASKNRDNIAKGVGKDQAADARGLTAAEKKLAQIAKATDKETAATLAQREKDAALASRNLDAAAAKKEEIANQTDIDQTKEGLEPSERVTEVLKGEPGNSKVTTYAPPRGEGGEGGPDAPRAPKPIFRKFTSGEGGLNTAKIYANSVGGPEVVDIKRLPNGGAIVHTKGFGDTAGQPFTEAEISKALGIAPEGPINLDVPVNPKGVVSPGRDLGITPAEAAEFEGASGAGGELPADTPTEMRRNVLNSVSAAISRSKGAGQLEVKIPGDGNFTVENNPHAISTLADKIRKEGASIFSDLGGEEVPTSEVTGQRGVLPVVPEAKVQPNPQAGAVPIISYPENMNPMVKTGEEYGLAQRQAQHGLTPEEVRAAKGQAAAASNTKANRASLTPDDLSVFPDRVQASLKKALARDRGESGQTAYEPMLHLATGAIGAGLGAYYEPDNRTQGAVLGGIAGAAAPLLGHGIINLASKYSGGPGREGFNNFFHQANKFRNSAILGPTSVARKGAGDAWALFQAGLESSLADRNFDKAGNILKQFVTPEGLGNIKNNFMEGLTNPENPLSSGLENFITNAKNPLSWSGRTMGGLTKATKGIMGEAGVPTEDINRYTFTNVPESEAGKAIYHYVQKHPAWQHFALTFPRMALNRIERGLEYSPFGMLNFDKPWEKNLTKAALGTGAGFAAYSATPENFVKEHPFYSGLFAAGPMGIPVMVGMAAGSRPQDPDKSWLRSTDSNFSEGLQAISRDIPGLEPLQNSLKAPLGNYGRNYFSSYTNVGKPFAEALDPRTKWTPPLGIKWLPSIEPHPAQVDTKSDDLNDPGWLFNKMLANVPFLRNRLPELEGGESPYSDVPAEDTPSLFNFSR